MSDPRRVSHPTSVAQAHQDRQAMPGAVFLAGGTDVMVSVGRRQALPGAFICLSTVADLQGIEASDEASTLGALTTLATVAADTSLPRALREAAQTAGSTQVTSVATVGGNLATRRLDQSLPPALIALNATVQLTGVDGERVVTAAELAAQGLAEGELITAVTVPTMHDSSIYLRVGPRNGPCYPTVAVAVGIDRDAQRLTIGVGGAGDHAFEATAAGDLAASAIDWSLPSLPSTTADDIADLVVQAARPASDVVASADYRRHALRVITHRALVRTYEEVPRRG